MRYSVFSRRRMNMGSASRGSSVLRNDFPFRRTLDTRTSPGGTRAASRNLSEARHSLKSSSSSCSFAHLWDSLVLHARFEVVAELHAAKL